MRLVALLLLACSSSLALTLRGKHLARDSGIVPSVPANLGFVSQCDDNDLLPGQTVSKDGDHPSDLSHTEIGARLPIILFQGYIRANYQSTNAFRGYLSSHLHNGLYGTWTQNISQALLVSYTSVTAVASQKNFQIRVGADDFPFLCAIEGPASTSPDLSTGSTNYDFLGGCSTDVPVGPAAPSENTYSTQPNKPKELAETAIWSIDANQKITVQWVNTSPKLSSTRPSLGSYSLILGDPKAFAHKYPFPEISINPLPLHFVPLHFTPSPSATDSLPVEATA
ncbi:hypothetical protein EHS25_009468 [Saitozyma podzolica]|uniref:Uncharacterized protein n=1 Tax=Saitozyma podzolica TaxID=1890683 RepID=A0A427YJC0_9TREE|nr:hypothetical protein EHS25_009468 [Saitozyma podzolica]